MFCGIGFLVVCLGMNGRYTLVSGNFTKRNNERESRKPTRVGKQKITNKNGTNN